MRFFLPKNYDHVEYVGYGTDEAYKDKKFSSYFGKFEAELEDLHEDYNVPQENGSHCLTEKFVLTSGMESISVISNDAFNFNASEYTQEELTKKSHNYELEKLLCKIHCLSYQFLI